jgi:hypothetical protein
MVVFNMGIINKGYPLQKSVKMTVIIYMRTTDKNISIK